ncbi:decarboxylating NADP(+)-dependent phosphogluconate dehydrogenase [Sabulibacter ruber]|uniref:decarboxylating NADP(+)-dependent phosphogluconate dehydrogenase n=1 Tax=Sabulibacter ruber TaxID=2811901 RepID=UPI001A9704BB|nr:decarboxylating NADP(+)-dependent phosphogluconate dehydrogenase [Sabulibacter ruber]
MSYMVMGVSGSGKSTVGRLLAERLQLHFIDADDHHLATSVEKMSQGIPLTDDDRWEWLQKLNHLLQQAENTNQEVVLACSALKGQYRQILGEGLASPLKIIYLHGEEDVLRSRLGNRKGHFMTDVLLQSQLQTLEIPQEALHLNIVHTPEELVTQIMQHFKPDSASPSFTVSSVASLGIIGMGVMGKSLALNLAGKGISVAVFNRTVPGKEEQVAERFAEENQTLPLLPFSELPQFVQALEKPRRILLMVKAGRAVEELLDQIQPLLEEGDLVMDGGNSQYQDTTRRVAEMKTRQVHFLGVGISGGEEGALKGPSLMPGGEKAGYEKVADILNFLAAQDKNGKPCCTYVGPDGAGHFVKMVHNGIEYAEMQALAEAYQLFRYHLNFSPSGIVEEFTKWQESGLNSYLLEITIAILQKQEDGTLLLDKILDAADQKGTGGWSTAAALELGTSLDSIAAAVMARHLSALKEQRVQAATLYGIEPEQLVGVPLLHAQQLKQAFEGVKLINHAFGFELMRQASLQFQWNLNLSEIARIWTNGCIIRSQLMEELVEMLKTEGPLLQHPCIVERLSAIFLPFKETVAAGIKANAALPVSSAALNYFLGYNTVQSPANLIQAQRDYFGAHTFRRTDQPVDQYFHVDW